MKQFRSAKKRITVSAGESVRIIRELQGLSQNQLAQRTGIPQATLSAIENDRVRLGVLGFPGWDDHLQSAASPAGEADALKRATERHVGRGSHVCGSER